MFYLNYVGCKVGLYERLLDTEISFTLTMWDVKGQNVFLANANIFCFTLTMWDVKERQVDLLNDLISVLP